MAGKRYIPALDVLRVVSALVIVCYHFAVEMTAVYPLATDAQRAAYGVLVALTEAAINVFFLLSGASLALGYGPQNPAPDWRPYAQSRLLSIYPMYWLGFGALFFYGEILHGNNPGIPRWRVVFSLLGLDGYLAQFTPTFYKIGEWFLGCLLLLYLLFPALVALLRAAQKHPALWAVPAGFCLLAWVWLPRAGAAVQYTHTVLFRLPVFFAGVLLGCYLARRPAPPPARRWRALRWLAGQCYGVFLVHHVFLTIVLVPRAQRLGYWPAFALYLPAVLALAWALQQAARPIAWALRRILRRAEGRRTA